MNTRQSVWPYAALMLAFSGTTCLAQTPVGFVNMVIAGAPDPNQVVPQFDIAPGSAVGNLSVAIPESVLSHGSVYVYWVSFESLSYTGTCTVSYQIARSGKIIQKAKILKFDCGPGNYGAGIGGAALPDSPGSATLTGEVDFGSTKVKLSAPVLIE